MSDILSASLTASTIVVEAVGRSWSIAPASATEWTRAVHSNKSPWSVFPGMLVPEDREVALDMMLTGEMDDFEAKLAGYSAIRQAAGRPWWEAIRLIAMCDDSLGQVLGKLTALGVNPDLIPFARWCAAIYHVATDGADQKELLKFNMKFQSMPNVPEAYEESGEDDFSSMVNLARSMPGMSG